MKSKSEKTLGFIAVIFFTFGITYLDFENLSSSENVRPYIMLGLGIIILIYWLRLRKTTK